MSCGPGLPAMLLSLILSSVSDCLSSHLLLHPQSHVTIRSSHPQSHVTIRSSHPQSHVTIRSFHPQLQVKYSLLPSPVSCNYLLITSPVSCNCSLLPSPVWCNYSLLPSQSITFHFFDPPVYHHCKSFKQDLKYLLLLIGLLFSIKLSIFIK